MATITEIEATTERLSAEARLIEAQAEKLEAENRKAAYLALARADAPPGWLFLITVGTLSAIVTFAALRM